MAPLEHANLLIGGACIVKRDPFVVALDLLAEHAGESLGRVAEREARRRIYVVATRTHVGHPVDVWTRSTTSSVVTPPAVIASATTDGRRSGRRRGPSSTSRVDDSRRSYPPGRRLTPSRSCACAGSSASGYTPT